MTYDNWNSIVTNTYLISYITVVCFNLTTQLSVVCVISIILYKYLTIYDKRIPCLTDTTIAHVNYRCVSVANQHIQSNANDIHK